MDFHIDLVFIVLFDVSKLISGYNRRSGDCIYCSQQHVLLLVGFF